ELSDLTPYMDVEQHFYDAIIKWIANAVYANISPRVSGEEQDIIQVCFMRVRNNLHKYKSPESGGSKLTTWVYTVCRNYVRTYYKQTKDYQSSVFNVEDLYESGFGVPIVTEPNHLDETIRVIVDRLFEKYPDRVDILTAMFKVNQNGDTYDLPTKISCADIANELGYKYLDVNTFYRRHVTPYFKKCFANKGF
ncbi:MAG: sigma-70 RNA polymerase sigma factor region 4 domain-containing protein, partial [Planctomycetota bacterium]